MDATAPRGYLSEDSKRRHTTRVVLSTIGFLVGTFAIPMAVMFAFMATTVFRGFPDVDASTAAAWRGDLWHLQHRAQRGSLGERVILMRASLREEDAAEVGELPADPDPTLLADDAGLWYVGRSVCGRLDDAGRFVAGFAPPEQAWSRPFLWNGRPAVLAPSSAGLAVHAMGEDGWVPAASVAADDVLKAADPDRVRAAAVGSGVIVFVLGGARLLARGVDGRWSQVADDVVHFDVDVLEGRPAAALLRQRRRRPELSLMRIESGEWREVHAIAAVTHGAVGLAVRDGGREALLAVEGPLRRLLVQRWSRGTSDAPVAVASGDPFDSFFRFWMFLVVALNASPLVLGLLIDASQRRHRTPHFESGKVRFEHASLTRRGLAMLVDALVTTAPMIAGYALMFPRMMVRGEPDPGTMCLPFALLLGGAAWALLVSLAISWQEGRTGLTPGKKLLGIRVSGVDLRPCGFGRALLRRLVLMADAQFLCVPALLTAALTENRQRIGDIVSKTVVLRDV